MNTIIFPKASGKNLQRKKFEFPKDFPTKFNLVLIAFYRHHQDDVDTWIPFAKKLESEFEDLNYFEFPVIYQMGPFRQFMLNEGMRAGIPDQTAREKTITLYLDKSEFLGQLGIQTQDSIQILLVSDSGEVLWRETGVFTRDKGTALINYLKN